LWFDADGVGGNAAMQLAILENAPVLRASDLLAV